MESGSIQYLGEQLIWGRIGNLFVVVAFTAALFSVFAYLFSLRSQQSGLTEEEHSWKRLARSSFFIHSISVVGIILMLIFLILRQRFEYYYVWEHSNKIMPLRYILSCLWEGQEGSFLLWMFWHVVLSWIIIIRSRTRTFTTPARGTWENGIMFTICMVQVFIASMLLGIVVFNYKLGSNPFVLLRNHPDFANLPFVQMPDYLSRIKDGRGLNPLLQNYWMTIHPPTLFLGFASTVVPFAFAIAGLIRKKYTEWILPALPWTVFSIMILGTGVLMGAAWAYESLSFGGFWAWDPVENASLVPWLTIVAAAHVMIIFKHRNHSLLSVYILTIITFILILYSTFLTRSGILGDTSVHAFTDLGMSAQLVIYILFFLVLSGWLLIKSRKQLLIPHDEEKISSREFWMFIGALVLVIGSLQITFTTSIPVINKIFKTNMAPPVNAIDHYNRWQVPIATIITILAAVGLFLKFKETDGRYFRKKIFIAFAIAIAVTAISSLYLKSYAPQYYALFFSSVFAVASNADYIVRVRKGELSRSGAPIAHIGFALIVLGALISNSKKEIISQNKKLINLGKDFPNAENIMIEQKTDTLQMGKYFVVYAGKEQQGVNVHYSIAYFTEAPNGKKEKAFELHPLIQLNERMGNVAEPSTKHFLTKDIYTHLTYADLEKQTANEWQEAKTHSIAVGDTFMTSNSEVILSSLDKNVDKSALNLGDQDLAVAAVLDIEDAQMHSYQARPVFIIRHYELYGKDTIIEPLGLRFAFTKIDPVTGKLDIAVQEKKSNKRDFVIMKAIIFPGINILWTGCILMIIGSILAIRNRIKKLKAS